MKRTLLFFCLFLVRPGLFAQIPSDCTAPPILNQYYDGDVKHLALKRIFDLQSPAMDSIDIPESCQDTIREAMAAVFNLPNCPPRDTVYDIYCIHQAISNYIFHYIYVNIEPTCPWYQNWQNLVITTGIPALDNLLSTYGFSIVSFWTAFNVATLYTNATINVLALCDSIETFSGVGYAEPVSAEGDGNSINYSMTGTDRSLDFVIGYGDCMCGCTGHKTYKFTVHDDCSVSYLGCVFQPDPGWPFPGPVNCYITTGTESKALSGGVHLFPNPVGSLLTVESDCSNPISISIINMLGKTIYTGQVRNRLVLPAEFLPAGVYTLLAYDDQKKKYFPLKFIKTR
jgi:hypothetical protein